MKVNRWCRILFLNVLVLLFLFIGCSQCLADVEFFTLKNRRAADVLPVVQALLSPTGKAVADRYANMIIVNDSATVIESVHDLLRSSDQPVQQVRIQMAFDSDSNTNGLVIHSSGSHSGRHLSTENMGGGYEDSLHSRSSRSFLTVSSGSSGYIRMAREVPVTDRWLFFCRRYGVPYLLQDTRTIETGMEVSPVVAGDNVIVTVTPRISWMDDDRVETYRFVDASTEISIPRSQWSEVGSMGSRLENRNDFIGAILATGSSRERERIRILIKADVD